jgi:hypothetical protein
LTGPRLENGASLVWSAPFPVAPTVITFFDVPGEPTAAKVPMFPLENAIR